MTDDQFRILTMKTINPVPRDRFRPNVCKTFTTLQNSQDASPIQSPKPRLAPAWSPWEFACALCLSLAVGSLPASAANLLIREVAKLTAEDGAVFDLLGFSPVLNATADVLAVGAHFRDDRGTQSGALYIFERDPSGGDHWQQRQKLVPDDLTADDRFGTVSDIERDTLVSSTRPGGVDGTASGAVYIFHRGDQGSWIQTKKLISPADEFGDQYGGWVELEGDTLVVGAGWTSGTMLKKGAVYIYDRNAEEGLDPWGLIKTVEAPDGDRLDEFGRWSSLSGDTLLVSAQGDDDRGVGSGSVYFFEKNEGGENNWGFVKKLTAPDGAPGDQFGDKVDLSGNVALIGAPKKDEQGSNSGAAYLFERHRGGENNWGFVKKLLPLPPSEIKELSPQGRSMSFTATKAAAKIGVK